MNREKTQINHRPYLSKYIFGEQIILTTYTTQQITTTKNHNVIQGKNVNIDHAHVYAYV